MLAAAPPTDRDRDLTALTASVKETLISAGQFGSIRAQLRAAVFGALAGQPAAAPPPSCATSVEAQIALAMSTAGVRRPPRAWWSQAVWRRKQAFGLRG